MFTHLRNVPIDCPDTMIKREVDVVRHKCNLFWAIIIINRLSSGAAQLGGGHTGLLLSSWVISSQSSAGFHLVSVRIL